MNRNTIIGLVLIFGIMIGYSLWMKPSKEEVAEQKRLDSLRRVEQVRALDSLNAIRIAAEAAILEAELVLESTSEQSDTTQKRVVPKDKLFVFSNSLIPDESTYFVENDVFKIEIASQGGKIISVELKDYQTYDSTALILFDPKTVKFDFAFYINNRPVNTDKLQFRPVLRGTQATEKAPLRVSGPEVKEFSMRLYADGEGSALDEDQYIEYVYRFTGDNYMLDLDVNIVGLKNSISTGSNNMTLYWNANLRQQEKGIDRFNGSTIYYKYFNDDVEYLSETKDEDEALSTRVKWISYKQRFFCSSLVAKEYFTNANVNVITNEDEAETAKIPRYLRTMESVIGVPVNFTGENAMQMAFYFGPLEYKTLIKYKLDFDRQIPLGWSFFLLAWINRYAVIPVFDFLSSFGWNYGIIILVLTILLKLFLLPIAYKTYMSSAKMRVLKPEVEEISKKYPKKEDAMKKQKATMDLYKRAGASPMAGCVPMLLQFPILIAMFRFFPSAIQLRQQSFLWATDLSTYDSILDLPFEIPFYGDHVSLFTLLMTVSTILYTRVQNEMMSSGQQQIQGMKTMMYLMPIMFLGFFNSYAAALSYYYLLANLITFAQMGLFRRFVNEDKIRARIEVNKKKPRKKSGFQKRLEDAAKQRGYNPNKRKK